MHSEFYGKGGIISEIDFPTTDIHSMYAKRIWSDRTKSYTYYIKKAFVGPEAPHLVNPWGMHFDEGVTNRRVETQRGRPRYDFIRVPQAAFDFYVLFLETSRDSLLRAAERELD